MKMQISTIYPAFCIGALLSYLSEITVLESFLYNPLTLWAVFDPILSNFNIINKNLSRSSTFICLWATTQTGFLTYHYTECNIYILVFQWMMFYAIFEIFSNYAEIKPSRFREPNIIRQRFECNDYIQDFGNEIVYDFPVKPTPLCVGRPCTVDITNLVNKTKIDPHCTDAKEAPTPNKDEPKYQLKTPVECYVGKETTKKYNNIIEMLNKYIEKLESNGDNYTAGLVRKYMNNLGTLNPNEEDIYNQILDLLTDKKCDDDAEENLTRYLSGLLSD